MAREFVVNLPDDPAQAQAHLVARLQQIAEEQCELTVILDEQQVPTHQYGERLTFHQRVACLAGLYDAVSGELEKLLRNN